MSNMQQAGHTHKRLVCRCMLGQNYTIARRKPETRCFNGRDYERRNSTGNCECQAVRTLLFMSRMGACHPAPGKKLSRMCSRATCHNSDHCASLSPWHLRLHLPLLPQKKAKTFPIILPVDNLWVCCCDSVMTNLFIWPQQVTTKGLAAHLLKPQACMHVFNAEASRQAAAYAHFLAKSCLIDTLAKMSMRFEAR